MVYNALAAAAVGEIYGLSVEEITRGIESLEAVSGRFHMIETERFLIVDDCYNANPQSMGAALRVLAGVKSGKRIAALGNMAELGDLYEQAHRDMGECTNRCAIDAVIAIGPKAKAITETAKGQVYWFATKEEAYDTLREQFTAGTIVLVKASHAMEFGKIVAELEAVKDI